MLQTHRDCLESHVVDKSILSDGKKTHQPSCGWFGLLLSAYLKSDMVWKWVIQSYKTYLHLLILDSQKQCRGWSAQTLQRNSLSSQQRFKLLQDASLEPNKLSWKCIWFVWFLLLELKSKRTSSSSRHFIMLGTPNWIRLRCSFPNCSFSPHFENKTHDSQQPWNPQKPTLCSKSYSISSPSAVEEFEASGSNSLGTSHFENRKQKFVDITNQYITSILCRCMPFSICRAEALFRGRQQQVGFIHQHQIIGDLFCHRWHLWQRCNVGHVGMHENVWGVSQLQHQVAL